MLRFALCVLSLLISTSAALAEFHCSNCQAIIKTQWWQGPCPSCGLSGTVHSHPHALPPAPPAPTPNPGPTPGGQPLMLGLNVYQGQGGVTVESVRPGTPAYGKFFPNDTIVRYAYRDRMTGEKFRSAVYQPGDINTMKNNAGAGNPIAVAVRRPNYGERKFLVVLPGKYLVTETRSYTVSGGGGDSQTAYQSVVPKTIEQTATASVTENDPRIDDLLGGSTSPQMIPQAELGGGYPNGNSGGGSLLDDL